MEFEQILKLIKTVSESSLRSFEFEEGETKLVLKKDRANSKVIHLNSKDQGENISTPSVIAPTVSTPVLPASESVEFDHVVKSPLVGTFYSASSPEVEAFVKVGDSVKIGQTMGIIEAMKLMNEIECDHAGVVEAILIENEQVVEFGQPLFRIR